MTFRYSTWLLVTTCLLLSRSAWSQGPMMPPGPGGQAWSPYANIPAGPIQPAGWHHPAPYGCPPQGECPPCDPALANTVYELLPEDRCSHHEPGDFDWMVDAVRGAWVRVDYMNYTIKAPGHTLLGATPSGIAYPRDFFLVDDGMGNTLGQARVLDVHKVDLDNINGAKLAFGIPLMIGSFEANVWALAETEDFVSTDQIPTGIGPPLATYIATPLLTNGAPGSTLILNDLGFRATYEAQVFGAEANLYSPEQYHSHGVHLEWMLGGRFLNYREQLDQVGLFNDNGLIIPPLRSFIGSEVTNSIFGPQVGLRAEINYLCFTAGIEPKLMLGANVIDASVRTETLRDAADPTVETSRTRTEFAALLDLGAYAKVQLHEMFSVRVGYNFLWMANVSRADRNIYYNDNGLLNPPAVVVQDSETDMWIEGLTIGGELTWR